MPYLFSPPRFPASDDHVSPTFTDPQKAQPGDPKAPLAERVLDLLKRAGLDTHSLRISVHNDIVTLRGCVPNRWIKYRVEPIAAQVEGVSDVDNLLELDAGSGPAVDATPG